MIIIIIIIIKVFPVYEDFIEANSTIFKRAYIDNCTVAFNDTLYKQTLPDVITLTWPVECFDDEKYCIESPPLKNIEVS